MEWYGYLVGALLIVAALAIVIIVLMQQSRQAGLSGAIAGGSETFFGKNKGRSMDAKLAKFTKVLGVIFFILSLVATFLIAFLSNL